MCITRPDFFPLPSRLKKKKDILLGFNDGRNRIVRRIVGIVMQADGGNMGKLGETRCHWDLGRLIIKVELRRGE